MSAIYRTWAAAVSAAGCGAGLSFDRRVGPFFGYFGVLRPVGAP